MELEDALFRFVALQAPITSIIGEPTRIRFFKLKVEQGARMPSMVQQRSGDSRTYSQCSVSGAVAVSLQMDFYAKTWAEAANLSRLFRRSLEPTNVTFPLWFGSAPEDSPPIVGVRVKAASLETQFDLDDPEPGLFRRTQLWRFWIVEDEPAIEI